MFFLITKSYWSIIAAAVGWLILTGAVPAPQRQIQSVSAEQSIGQAVKGRRPRSDQPARAEEKDKGCLYGKEDRSSDLCAQWKAADAAAEAAIWARETYNLTLVGTAAVVGALLLAMWSNRIALRAVEMDSRPWLSPIEMTCDIPLQIAGCEDELIGFAKLELKNTGNSPATRIWIRWIQCDFTAIDRKFWKRGAMGCTIPIIAPGSSEYASLTLTYNRPPPDHAVRESTVAIEINYFVPNKFFRKRVRQSWEIGSSLFLNQVQPLIWDKMLLQAPVARAKFTHQMT